MQAAFNAKTLNKEAWDLILIDVLNSVIENYDVMKNLANKTKYYNPGFDQKIKFEDLDNDYIIRPHFSNDRIKNQNGGFLLLNALDKSNNNNVPEKYIDTVWIIDLEKGDDDKASEVSRQEFLEQLRYMGIDQSFVYPELENFICTDYLEVVDSTLKNAKGE